MLTLVQSLTLNLLEPKVIYKPLSPRNTTKPACKFLHSDQALTNFDPKIPKIDNEQFQKWKLDKSI
jgi:hypothetical protein